MSQNVAITIAGIISFALVAIRLWPLQANAAARTEPAIHFAIDVSGSMSGEIQTAVNAIDAVAAETPDTMRLGLRS
jgi:hypothetical protein